MLPPCQIEKLSCRRIVPTCSLALASTAGGRASTSGRISRHASDDARQSPASRRLTARMLVCENASIDGSMYAGREAESTAIWKTRGASRRRSGFAISARPSPKASIGCSPRLASGTFSNTGRNRSVM